MNTITESSSKQKKTRTFEYRCNLEHTQPANGKHLPHSQFHEEHWNTSKDKRKEVGDKKSATAIFITKVGKSPNVAETNSQADYGENEVEFAGPGSSFGEVRFGGHGTGTNDRTIANVNMYAALCLYYFSKDCLILFYAVC